MLNYNLSHADYLAHPAINASRLKLMLKTPRDFKEGNTDDEDENKATPSQELGTAIHALVLEPDEFEKRYVLSDIGNLTLKENKARYKLLTEENPGRTILRGKNAALLQKIQREVSTHHAIRVLLAYGRSEVTAFAQGYIPLKARADLLLPNAILDVKTTTGGMSDTDIYSVIKKFHYDFQAAHYLKVFNSLLGNSIQDFMWLFINTSEKNKVNHLRLIKAPAAMLAIADKQHTQVMETLSWCMENDTWPGYSDEITELEMPAWAMEFRQ